MEHVVELRNSELFIKCLLACFCVPVSPEDPIPQHNVLAEIDIRNAMVEVVAFGFVQVNSKKEWNLDIVSLVVEAGCCIGGKHDQIPADNMHLHKATHQEHGPKSIVLTKGIL